MPIAQSSSKSQTGNSKSTKQIKTNSFESMETTEQKPQQPEVSNTGTKTPPEQPEFVKQTLIIIEKKVRNLDKRRLKLEEYKESARKGAKLNEDQLNAVAKFDEVIRTLELTKELEKQFVGLANDTMKQQKKQMKKEQLEREELLKEKLRDGHRYLSLLNTFSDQTVRSEFLSEAKGSRVTEAELQHLDEFNKLIEPCTPGAKSETAAVEYADHLSALVDGKNKPVPSMTNTVTYNELKKLFERLLSDSYWTEQPTEEEVTETVQTTQVVVETTTETTETQQTLSQAVDNLQLNEQQQVQQNDQVYQNVDDFVIVSSSECAESLCHSKSSSVQPQVNPEQVNDAQKKTFFTTLNQPTEQRQNINEFINSCENNGEGLNFFQDSELQARQNEQQNEMNFQGQPQENNFNQQSAEMQKDQGFKQQRGNNRQYQQRRHPNGNGQQRTDNRGPRNNNGYRGGNNSGPRGDSNGQRGGYRGQNGGRQNNGYRGNYQQQQHQSQMA